MGCHFWGKVVKDYSFYFDFFSLWLSFLFDPSDYIKKSRLSCWRGHMEENRGTPADNQHQLQPCEWAFLGEDLQIQ